MELVTDTRHVSPEVKFVIGGATPFLVRAFLTGEGIDSAHYFPVSGLWQGSEEKAVALVIAGLTYYETENLAVKLCVYFAQESVYVTYRDSALIISPPPVTMAKPDSESRERWYRG